jgi:hypothetical protein
MLATIILWLIGFLSIYSGRIEFGPVHSHKVMLAMIFVIIYVVISISRPFLSFSFLVYGTGPGYSGIGPYNTTYLIIEMVFGLAASIFLSLVYVFLIIELASARTRILLWISLGLNVMFSTGGPFIIFIFSYESFIFANFGMVFIVLIFVIYCYWDTYERVRKRIIKPLLVPMIPPPFFPYGPPPAFPPPTPPQYPQRK